MSDSVFSLFEPNKKIGNYVLNRPLGRGGMGVVWLATDSRLDRKVAVKLISVREAGHTAARRLVKEARALAKLNHQYIVHLYDAGEEDDNLFIVTEYVHGFDLGSLLRQGPLSPQLAGTIVGQVAEALAFAHKNGIIHRDIKPSNIFVDSESLCIKLGDFGIAKGDSEPRDTMPGVILGTLRYLSPEVADGGEATFRSDVYSLGVTFFQLLTGEFPPSWERFANELDRENKILKELPPLPQKVLTILMRMICPDPAKRPGSLEEVMASLKDLVFDPADYADVLGQISEKMSSRRPDSSYGEPDDLSSESEMGPVTIADRISAPTDFFDSTLVRESRFFGDDRARVAKIQESLTFYRDHLTNEYASLLRQADLTYKLWLGCVALGFCVLVGGVIAMLVGHVAQGAATAASTILLYFIQRVFHEREDHYRSLATAKNSHLEYGNHWLLVIQSIESIEDEAERKKRQSRLVDVLTTHLDGAGKTASRRPRNANDTMGAYD